MRIRDLVSSPSLHRFSWLMLLAAACSPDQASEGPTAPLLEARTKPPAAPSLVGQDLGVLPGDNQSVAFGVNDAGRVVGQSANGPGAVRAFYWDGAIQSLTTPGSRGAAYAISSGATSYAVGYEEAPGSDRRAVRWILPSTTPVDLDPGPAFALGVNDAGTAVGSYCASGCGASEAWQGAIWTGGVRTSISPLPGYAFGYATDINNSGLVVGASSGPVATSERAYLRLADGTLIALPPQAGFPNSTAEAVSDIAAGQVYVAGFSRGDAIGSATRSMRWTVNATTGQIVETVALEQRYGMGVNLAGDVAGSGGSPSNPAATLWRGGSYIALKAPKGGSGSFARGLARAGGSPTYAVGETSIKNWPRALRWVIP